MVRIFLGRLKVRLTIPQCIPHRIHREREDPLHHRNHPTNIILLTCDARGVLPPISKLDHGADDVPFHFRLHLQDGWYGGWCDGAPGHLLVMLRPTLLGPAPYALCPYARDKISEHKANAWLLNTGWVGAGATTGGKRCPLKYTRAILDAIHSGELAKAEYEVYPVFNLHVPKSCPNVPSELLNPKKSWTASVPFLDEVVKLAKLFNENFKKYSDEATKEVIAAGPVTEVAPAEAPSAPAVKSIPVVRCKCAHIHKVNGTVEVNGTHGIQTIPEVKAAPEVKAVPEAVPGAKAVPEIKTVPEAKAVPDVNVVVPEVQDTPETPSTTNVDSAPAA